MHRKSKTEVTKVVSLVQYGRNLPSVSGVLNTASEYGKLPIVRPLLGMSKYRSDLASRL